MRRTFSILVFLSFLSFLFSQQKSSRIEYELRDGYENETILPLDEHGFIVWSNEKGLEKGKTIFKNDYYSTGMKLLSTEVYSMKGKVGDYVTYSGKDGLLYTLVQHKNDNIFSLFISDIKSQKTTSVVGKLPKGTHIYSMKVENGVAVVDALSSKVSSLFFINISSGKLTKSSVKIKKYSNKSIIINDYDVSDSEITTFILAQKSKSKKDIYAAHFDFEGNQKRQYLLTEEQEEKFISVSGTPNKNKLFLTGTYSTNIKKGSQGIYFSEIENDQINFIKYHNFLDLENFTKFMSKRNQDKIERRKKRKEETGKEYLLNYNIASHPIIPSGDGYIYLGEAYYPVYNTYTTYINGVMTTQRVFAGYEYTHAVLCKLNKNGEIVWSDVFEIANESRPYYVKRFISFNKSKTIDLKYSSGTSVYSKSFDENTGNVISKGESEIQTYTEGDKVRRSSSNIQYWYDDYFITYGTQIIINKDKERKRRVIYINKESVKK